MTYYLSLRYRVILSPEEDGWSATIAELPGCIAAGDTPEETLTLLEDAKRSWAEALEMLDVHQTWLAGKRARLW